MQTLRWAWREADQPSPGCTDSTALLVQREDVSFGCCSVRTAGGRTLSFDPPASFRRSFPAPLPQMSPRPTNKNPNFQLRSSPWQGVLNLFCSLSHRTAEAAGDPKALLMASPGGSHRGEAVCAPHVPPGGLALSVLPKWPWRPCCSPRLLGPQPSGVAETGGQPRALGHSEAGGAGRKRVIYSRLLWWLFCLHETSPPPP